MKSIVKHCFIKSIYKYEISKYDRNAASDIAVWPLEGMDAVILGILIDKNLKFPYIF
jgi:hypothetical protein